MTTSALGTPVAARGRQDSGGGRPEGTRRLLAAGASAACMAAGAGLAVMIILVLAGWVAAPHSGLGLIGVLRTAAVLWLVGHHVTVQVSDAGRIGMLPLGLVALPGALLWRAGRAVVRDHRVMGLREVLAVALAVAVPYAALAGGLAVASRSHLAAASIPQALLASFMIAFVATGFGAARALAPWAQLGALMSARTRSVLVGTVGSLAVLTAAGAMATALALAGDVHRFGDVYRAAAPGPDRLPAQCRPMGHRLHARSRIRRRGRYGRCPERVGPRCNAGVPAAGRAARGIPRLWAWLARSAHARLSLPGWRRRRRASGTDRTNHSA